jgi:hypothetical protein
VKILGGELDAGRVGSATTSKALLGPDDVVDDGDLLPIRGHRTSQLQQQKQLGKVHKQSKL